MKIEEINKVEIDLSLIDCYIQDEYTFDYSKGVVGKYYRENIEENGYIKLSPELQKYFKSSEEVNNFLLSIIKVLKINNSNFIKL